MKPYTWQEIADLTVAKMERKYKEHKERNPKFGTRHLKCRVSFATFKRLRAMAEFVAFTDADMRDAQLAFANAGYILFVHNSNTFGVLDHQVANNWPKYGVGNDTVDTDEE